MTEPGTSSLRSRTIGVITADASEAEIIVEHVYMAEGSYTCDHCGSGHDAGSVGLIIGGGEGNNGSVLLSAEEALALANRLTRGASLVFEAMEGPVDMEREAGRLAEEARQQEEGP